MLRNTALLQLVAIILMAFSLNVNSSAQAQPAPTTAKVKQAPVENLGECLLADQKASLTCCAERASNRLGQCKSVVKSYFATVGRQTAATKAGKAFEPNPTEKCLAMSDEKSAVTCCTTTLPQWKQWRCIEQTEALAEVGKITASVDADFRASVRTMKAEELRSRRGASYRIAKLKLELKAVQDDYYAKRDLIMETLKQLPEAIRKEVEGQLKVAITLSEQKAVQTITEVETDLNGRIDKLSASLELLDIRVTTNTDDLKVVKEDVEALKKRLQVGMGLGFWSSLTHLGVEGGLKLNLRLEWVNAHFEFGGGLGASGHGIGWTGDVAAFYHLGKSFSFGGAIAGVGDAGDLKSELNTLLGAGPALQVALGEKFSLGAKVLVGIMVRKGCDPKGGVGLVLDGGWHF